MPANRGLGSPNWCPQPDFQSRIHTENSVDERVFEMYNERDVADCLYESDPQVEAYKWSLSDDELNQLALESARTIIENRRSLLLVRQLEVARQTRRARGEVGKTAIVVGTIEDLTTGETTAYTSEVPVGRAFG